MNKTTCVATLTDLGVIRATGDDVRTFLHGQLTNDVLLMRAGEARLAAYCNAKGRMQASLIVIQESSDACLLVLHRSLIDALIKRLRMFVLRAKVALTDASADWTVQGHVGNTPDWDDLPAVPWSHATVEGKHAVRLWPSLGVSRCLILVPASHDSLAADDLAQWSWLEVASGVNLLTAQHAEAFVPQMINYESVGGVNFKKGCYPGQEIVARSQFRGAVKRKGALFTLNAPAAPMDELFHTSDPAQAAGTVVTAAPAPDGTWWVFASITTALGDAPSWHLKTPGGPAMNAQPLPYPILDI